MVAAFRNTNDIVLRSGCGLAHSPQPKANFKMLLEVQSAVYLLLDCAHEHLFISFFTALLINAISIKYQKGLRSVPGPWLAGFSNVWRFAVVWKRDMPASSILLHEKHGSLVRMGPNHVSVADPEALKIIYGSDSRYQKVLQPVLWGLRSLISLPECILPHSSGPLRRECPF